MGNMGLDVDSASLVVSFAVLMEVEGLKVTKQ
jgi:hypothetical protein